MRSLPLVNSPPASLPAARAGAGFEPRRLYNVVEFIMNDKDSGGTVSVEEVMGILFLRFGKEQLNDVRP